MMNTHVSKCPLCGSALKGQPEEKNATQFFCVIAYLDCPSCGKYGFPKNALEDRDRVPKLNEEERATLAAFVCERHLAGKRAVILWPENREQMVDVRNEIRIAFARIMNEFPLPPITERFDRALLNLSNLGRPGKMVRVERTHLGLFYAENLEMLLLIYTALRERDYLLGTPDPRPGAGPDSLPADCKITAQGWVRVEEINRGHLGKNNRQAFVAMWFDPSMDDTFSNGIAPAIKAAGFMPFRVDKKESNNQITDEIVAGIRKSKFMVADITGNRSAVYYEAGLMHGLGRPVIFTCKNDHFKHASFDTNHYPHIQWETAKELREKLLNRIQATIVD